MAKPLAGSASEDTSGTVRMVPVTPVPVCQLGLAKTVETPPPAVLQALSEE